MPWGDEEKQKDKKMRAFHVQLHKETVWLMVQRRCVLSQRLRYFVWQNKH